MRTLKVTLFFLCLAMFQISVNAQDSVAYTQTSTGQVHSVPVSESFYVVDIITNEEISLLNAQSLNDVLKYKINLLPVYTGVDGYSLDFIANGRKNVKILLNSLPVWQSSIDKIDLSRWPVYDIEKIEIMYGNNSVLYGTHANQVVVNIITKWRKESYNTLVADFNFSGKDEYNVRFKNYLNFGRHRFMISGGRYFFNGYQGTDSNRVMQWKPYRQYTLDASYQYMLMQDVTAYVNATNINTKVINKGYPLPNTLRVYDNDQYTNQTLVQAGIRGRMSKYHYVDFSHSYSRYALFNDKQIKIRNKEGRTQPDPDIQPYDRLKYDEYFSQLKLSRTDPGRKFDYEAGMEFSHQRDLERSVLYAIKTSITTLSMLGDLTYKASDQLWLKAGARYTHSNKFSTPFIYNGQLRYVMSPDAQFIAQYSKGYRSPTFNELFYTYENPAINIKGNLSLQSETYQLFNSTLKIGSQSVFFTTSMFWMNTQNAIQLLQVNETDQVYQFVNTKQAKFTGQLLTLNSRGKIVDTRISLANNGVNQYPEEIGNYYFFQEFAGRVIVRIPGDQLSLMYAMRHSTKRSETRKNTLSDDLEDFNQEGFWLMDFSLRAKALKGKMEFRFGIKNITNVTNVAGKFLPIDRLSDQEINSKIPLSIDYGRRGWMAIALKI
ncbi:MAG: TonB-dependent receptor [Bacteroidetes bacterium]|nr:TonB-dependent receptor [Bacteroidota bacterium]